MPSPAASASASPSVSPAPSHASLPAHPDRVLIMHASETGHAQDLAERVARAVRRHGRRAACVSMDDYDVAELLHEPLVVAVVSTHGRGEPPPAMRALWDRLIRRGLPDDILEVYGLGDSSYDRFCYAGKMLARRLEGLGATSLVEPVWGDERAPDGYEETFKPWLQATLDAVLPYLPAPSAHVLPAPIALPPPLYTVERLGPGVDGDVAAAMNGLALPSADGSSTAGSGKAQWVWSTLRRNRRVTAPEWWQDVRELELELEEPLDYAPGSICALRPQCTAEEVDAFISLSGLEGVADDRIILRPTAHAGALPPHLPREPTTLRTLLTAHLDLRAAPRTSTFEWLRRFATDERERERLDEFVADPDEVHTYATRARRSLVETLADFRETRVPLEYVAEVVPPLRRRQFSIASSAAAHPGKVQLLVALVEYRTNLKVARRGLCSSWLDTLPEGARVPVQIMPPTLTLPPPSTPLILVGPGTGVAPMRAMLEERVRQGATETALYFGCRSTEADLFYAGEWDAYRAKGVKVAVAASRDQADKVYVQDLIRRDKAMVAEWLGRGAYVFISGSSNAMPKAVREALAYAISADGAGHLDEEQATEYVDRMFDDGRGQEESW